MEMAIEDAAQQALGVLCQHHHTPLCQTQYRYFPRRQSGDTEHEIASIRGEDNRQLLKLVRPNIETCGFLLQPLKIPSGNGRK
ncbi:hypothetical protein U9M48_032054 [Paspalum notatum var. saurae]|uniref:Uncharacterized protein n=1 Tax=Paspalum notatum var. saurae TaxID=547442 RepID=A0AAQ3U494_PASNO